MYWSSSCKCKRDYVIRNINARVQLIVLQLGCKVHLCSLDAIENISVETHSQQGDVIGQFCIHEMEVDALAERVSELCI